MMRVSMEWNDEGTVESSKRLSYPKPIIVEWTKKISGRSSYMNRPGMGEGNDQCVRSQCKCKLNEFIQIEIIVSSSSVSIWFSCWWICSCVWGIR